MEQLEPAASVVPQALLPVVIAKSVGLDPAMVMPLIVSAALPVFESVAACAAEVVPVLAVKAAGAVSDAIGTVTTAKLAVTLSDAFIVMVVDALLVLATLPVQLVKT
jgi:hypothetical protein